MKNKEVRDKWKSKVQQQEKTIRKLIKTLQKIVVMAGRTCANDDDINMNTLDGIDRIRLAAMDAIAELEAERDRFRETLHRSKLPNPAKSRIPNRRRMKMQSEFTLIEAASVGKPKVVGTAYSGGKMKLPGWKYPMVVDLAGMKIPEDVPLLANRENNTTARVGMVTANVADGILGITGEIVSGSDDAKDIIAQCKAGADWQLSIGADVKECELVQNRGREVNSQMHEAPFYHIRKSTLRDVSVVAVGADASTRMQIAALTKELNELEEERNQNGNA